jgi:hypothetical protein
MQSDTVCSLNHDLTTSLGLSHVSPIFQKSIPTSTGALA